MLSYSTISYKDAIYSEFLNESLYNLLDKTFQIPDSYSYNVFEVTKEYIARPDLISYDAYGDTMYGDIICKLNGISNPFELNEGMKLIIPQPEDISRFSIYPASEDSEYSDTLYEKKPVSKKKSEKRQSNETIIGDSRFKIDSVNGIIIY